MNHFSNDEIKQNKVVFALLACVCVPHEVNFHAMVRFVEMLSHPFVYEFDEVIRFISTYSSTQCIY